MSKRIREIDEYTFSGTAYLTVETADGWLYRFNRPAGETGAPYQPERRQRPDGSWSDRENPLPDAVVNELEVNTNYDVVDMNGRPVSERRDE